MSYWTPMELALLEENKDKINALDKDNPEEVVVFVENLIRENIHGLQQQDIYKWRFGFYAGLIPQSLKVVICSHPAPGERRYIYFKIKPSFNFKGGALVVFNSDVDLLVVDLYYKVVKRIP